MIADARTTFGTAFLVVVAVGMVCTGLYSALKPERAVQSSYRWDRQWARWMSFGKLESPGPLMSDETAARVIAVAGIVLTVVGIGILVGVVVSLSR